MEGMKHNGVTTEVHPCRDNEDHRAHLWRPGPRTEWFTCSGRRVGNLLMLCPFEDGPLYSFYSTERMAEHLETEHGWGYFLIKAYLDCPWVDNGTDRDEWFSKSVLREHESHNLVPPPNLNPTGRRYWTHLWGPYITAPGNDLGRCNDCPFDWNHPIHDPVDWFSQNRSAYWWEFPGQCDAGDYEYADDQPVEPDELAAPQVLKIEFTAPPGTDALKEAIRRMVKFQPEHHVVEPLPSPVEVLTDWWLKRAEDEARAVVPKATEYGSNSLMQLGRKQAQLQGRVVPDDEALELGCWINLVQKVERWTDSVMRSERPSEDTIYDCGIYVKMAQRIRDAGSWPGVDLVE